LHDSTRTKLLNKADEPKVLYSNRLDLALHSKKQVLFFECGVNMAIKKGDKVKVNYTGTLDDGTVFDSSTHGDHEHPIEFTVGNGELIKGFDDGVIGMKKGDEKTIKIEPANAYGEHQPDLVKKFPRANMPPEAKVGMILGLKTQDGHQFPATITAMDDKEVSLDLNHPLAGKRLTFKISVVEVQ
jgi:peptidylprolyl isomerase